MHFAPFAALATIACAISAVALPVSDTAVLGVRAPEAVVARTESAVDDVLNKLQTVIAEPIATLEGLSSGTDSSEIVVEESDKIYAAFDEAALALDDLKSDQDLDQLFSSSGRRNAAEKLLRISLDTLSALASVKPLLTPAVSRLSVEKSAGRVNNFLSDVIHEIIGNVVKALPPKLVGAFFQRLRSFENALGMDVPDVIGKIFDERLPEVGGGLRV